MNFRFTLIYLIISCSIAFASESKDTSGLYINKEDFIRNKLEYQTKHAIRITGMPFWIHFFTNETACEIIVHLPNGAKNKLNPSSFYGFRTNGIDYVYIKDLHEYVAVLNQSGPDYIFVINNVHFSNRTAFSDATFYFSHSSDDSLKEYSIDNINKTFGVNSNTSNALIDLMKEIKANGLDGELHRRQFFQCKQLVEKYLSKLKKEKE